MTEPPGPGIFPGIPESVYRSDRSALSQSGAKLLLPPSCPAKFRYAMDNPPKPKRQYDFGHAAHKFVLGEGEEIVPVDADDWRTKAAKDQRESAHTEGKIPLLRAEVDRAAEMADAIAAHPITGPLFASGIGVAEVSMYADDADSGVRLRGRADWLTSGTTLNLGDRPLIADYKTSVDSNPDTMGRTAFNYAYALQFAWYVTLASANGLEDPIYLLVFQEKTPPYLITVAELDLDAFVHGRGQMERAIAIYAECQESGSWPGYYDGIYTLSLPPWAFATNQPTIADLFEGADQ